MGVRPWSAAEEQEQMILARKYLEAQNRPQDPTSVIDANAAFGFKAFGIFLAVLAWIAFSAWAMKQPATEIDGVAPQANNLPYDESALRMNR